MADDLTLSRCRATGICWWTDGALLAREGVLVAFSERDGGASRGPYEGLNLAGHVGDDPTVVDRNRTSFLDAVGLGDHRSRLVTADQVHGDRIVTVTDEDVGRGSSAACEAGRGPVPGTDALICSRQGVPLLLFFADCVPIILVAPGPVVAVVHAGWRGALASLPGSAVIELATKARCGTPEIRAYVGAHVQACHYDVDVKTMSHFVNVFGTVARAESGGLDLGAVVNASLIDSGVDSCNITALGICTAEATDRFYSYRAEAGLTGRHGALVCILPR